MDWKTKLGPGGHFGVVVLLGCLLGPWSAVHAQTTAPASNKINKCSYNFLVPEPDLIDNCQKFADKQLESLRVQMESLKTRLANLTGTGTEEDQSDLAGLQFQCKCNNRTRIAFTYRDCQDVKSLAGGLSGMYNIEPIRSTGKLIHVEDLESTTTDLQQRYWVTKAWPAMQVYCDLEEELVGWTVILRRSHMNVSFDRDWYSYQHGFGSAEGGGDFWLGLENIHRITSQAVGSYSLWLVVADGTKVPHVYPYDKFSLDGEKEHYTIHLDGYHGSLTSRFSDDRPFTSKDHQPPMKDTPRYGRINCASSSQSGVSGGGWWFSGNGARYYYYDNDYDCGRSNLFASPPIWSGLSNVTRVEMKIRPSD